MIIFDMDGTLWNTLEATKKAALTVKERYEINDFDISSVSRGMGLSHEENLVNYYPNISHDLADKYLREVGKETILNINEFGAMVYDGVVETIKKLSEKYKLGIITNNTDGYVESLFKSADIKEYITDYMGASTYGITKSEAIKEMIKRNQEEKGIYVGDIKKDMEAALGADAEFIYAKYGFGSGFEYKYYINDIKELPNLISEILD